MSKYFQVYVGNLPTNVSNLQLRELFSPLGDVLHIWINRQFKTITYAFIGFADLETCNEVCKRFDNYELGLSKLKVAMSFKNEDKNKDKNKNKKEEKTILQDLRRKEGMTKMHVLNLTLMKDLRENRDIRESFKMAMQDAEYVTDIDKFEVVKHVGEPCNLETLEETVIRNFKKPHQKKPIAIDIDLTKGKRLSLEQNDRLFNLKFQTTTTTTTTTATTTATGTKTKQQRRKIPVSMDYRSVCD